MQGFSEGFRLGFTETQETKFSKNLKSALEFLEVVRDKLESELSSGRIAGPFENIPFKNFRVSPIGLVSKKQQEHFVSFSIYLTPLMGQLTMVYLTVKPQFTMHLRMTPLL